MRLVRRRSPIVVSIAVVGAALMPGPAAHAAYPGANGLIAYAGLYSGEVRVVNPDGTNDRLLIPSDGVVVNHNPVWAPQGDRVVYARGQCCSFDIWVARADGSGAKDLTPNDVNDFYPTWSPNGKQIAFGRTPPDYEIYAMNADGSNQRDLTNNPAVDWGPSWSSNGSIAFTSDRDGNREIYKMNADGSNQVRLTNNPAEEGYPDWSPDGHKIVFTSNRDGNHEIYAMDANGAHQVRLTNNTATDLQPTWSPDGQKIVFTSDRSGAYAGYTMNADGSDQVLVALNIAVEPSWRPMTSANKTVTVDDSGFTPSSLKADQGSVVQWNFAGTGSHTATDASGTGAFGSGAEPSGGAYAATLFAAGTYEAIDDFTSHTGLVKVPVIVDPPSGPPGTMFTITWSSMRAPLGVVFDVQIQVPGFPHWLPFKYQKRNRKTTYTPPEVGTYSFRARLRNRATGAHTEWSPATSIMVGTVGILRAARG